MSSNRSDDDTLFSWPPAPADMERIDVLDVTRTAPPAATPSTAASSEAPHPATARRRGRTHRRRSYGAPRDPWLTLAAGMIIGMVLPGVLQVRPPVLPGAHAEAAVPGTASAHALAGSDHAALRAMQALLRGEVPARTHAGTEKPAADVPPAAPPGVAPANPAAPTSTAKAITPTPPAVAPATGLAPARAELPPARKRTRRAAARAVPPPTAPPIDARDLEVRSVLQAYQRAWTRMDVEATRSLWPSADVDRVQAAFEPVREQRLELAACDVGLSGDRALAVCLGTRRFRPRNGTPVAQVERGRWEFELQRSDAGWQISTVDHP